MGTKCVKPMERWPVSRVCVLIVIVVLLSEVAFRAAALSPEAAMSLLTAASAIGLSVAAQLTGVRVVRSA